MKRGLAACVLFTAACATAPVRSGPLSAADSAAIEQLIQQGTELHDRGDYDGAAAKYHEALELDSTNPLAWYELAFTLTTAGKHREAIAAARKGLERPWKGVPALYMMIGSAHDDLGEREEALAAYREGLDRAPDFQLLHFNLAVAYFRMGAETKALACAKNALTLDPTHPGSHLLIAKMYLAKGMRAPAVAALGRFLALEPATNRSTEARELLVKAFAKNLKPGEKTTTILVPSAPGPEGDFGTVELGMSLIEAALTVPDHMDKRPPSLQRLSSALSLLGERKTTGTAWTEQYYAPFYAALAKAGLTETFTYVALRGDGAPEISAWLAAHGADVTRLEQWVGGYIWPDLRVPVLDDNSKL